MLSLTLFAFAASLGPSGELVTIRIEAEPAFTRAHTISIASQASTRPRTAQEREGQTWTATRTWEGGSQTVTSAECTVLQEVATSFGELPAVEINPAPLALLSGDTEAVPPTIKDGFATTLSFQTRTSDASTAEVTIRGGNAYQSWGHEAVSALISCWGPLTP